MSTILVTGGAGYIGSHVVRQLGEHRERLVTLDNLSSGYRSAVLYGEFIAGDTGDAALVAKTLREHRIDTVMHFAAHISVPESVENPLKYYRNNTANTRTLLECSVAAGVRNFVFSSTAAVYGMPAGGIATPMTYRLGPDSRQFIVIAAGGHAKAPGPASDHLMAFALPAQRER